MPAAAPVGTPLEAIGVTETTGTTEPLEEPVGTFCDTEGTAVGERPTVWVTTEVTDVMLALVMRVVADVSSDVVEDVEVDAVKDDDDDDTPESAPAPKGVLLDIFDRKQSGIIVY